MEWPQALALLAALSGLSGVAAFVSAWLVFKRAGQTVEVAAEDSDSKRFEVISAGQERLRLALLARLDEVERENAGLQARVATLTDQMARVEAANVELRHHYDECIRENSRQTVRLDELERLVSSYRLEQARAEGNVAGRAELRQEQDDHERGR